MMRMVAREDDLVVCIKHALGKIGRVDREVYVNGKAIAGVGDGVECLPGGDPKITLPPYAVDNRLMAGAAEVLVGGTSVVGLLHAAQHNSGPTATPNGFVMSGSSDVYVGGNTAIGNVAAALAACEAAAMTRKFKGVPRGQSYDNCGCEAMRQIINGKKGPYDPGYVSEDEFLDRQIAAGNAQVELDDKQKAEQIKRCKACDDEVVAAGKAAGMEPFPTAETAKRQKDADAALAKCKAEYNAEVARKSRKNRRLSGGTDLDERNRMGNEGGVPTESGPWTVDELTGSVAQGKGVVVTTVGLPGGPKGTQDNHIVSIAGVVVDDSGKPVEVIYNDSVAGCGQRLDADKFDKTMQTANAKSNVTKDPVW